MNEERTRITDGCERTVDYFKCKDGKYQVLMFEASSDYNQTAWFETKEEAMQFAERWVFKK